MAEQLDEPTDSIVDNAAQLAKLRVEAKDLVTVPPYAISDDLRPAIDALRLWDNVTELRDQGYTVVHDVAPPEVFDELREVIRNFADESAQPLPYITVSMLLGRHPVVDKLATLPKVLAIAEASVGQGMRAGQFMGSIMRQSPNSVLGLHADQNWIPAPFPEHNCVLTFCMPCEGMTAEEGATLVVPGSQALRRHPTPAELETPKLIPIEVPKGAVAVWDGSVWHSSGIRTVPGERTVLHATYQRLYTQPIDDYTYLLDDEAFVEHASPELLGLLGVDLFYGTATPTSGGPDMVKFMKSTIASKK